MDRTDLLTAFLSRVAIPGVDFSHNDYVTVVRGRNAGESGSLVSILDFVPEPKFILESENHGDIEVVQSEIERAEL